jgi:hypothetical protein
VCNFLKYSAYVGLLKLYNKSALIIFLAYKISLAFGIYCDIIITHIAIDVIYKSIAFSENNKNTGDNNKTEVPL